MPCANGSSQQGPAFRTGRPGFQHESCQVRHLGASRPGTRSGLSCYNRTVRGLCPLPVGFPSGLATFVLAGEFLVMCSWTRSGHRLAVAALGMVVSLVLGGCGGSAAT